MTNFSFCRNLGSDVLFCHTGGTILHGFSHFLSAELTLQLQAYLKSHVALMFLSLLVCLVTGVRVSEWGPDVAVFCCVTLSCAVESLSADVSL